VQPLGEEFDEGDVASQRLLLGADVPQGHGAKEVEERADDLQQLPRPCTAVVAVDPIRRLLQPLQLDQLDLQLSSLFCSIIKSEVAHARTQHSTR
jgi:hypothetical protein